MQKRFFTTAMAAALALNLAACGGGDSLGPQIQLTDAQTDDMIEALEAIGALETEFSMVSAAMRNRNVALFTETFDESNSCPGGGTIRLQGTFSGADDFSSFSADITESFTNCAALSTSNTLWTFNGAPNLKLVMTGTENLSTGAYTSNGSITGALNASSSMGSGACSFNVTLNVQGDNDGESGSATGTVCGKPFSETWNETF